MRKIVLSIVYIVFGIILLSQQAFAHVLETNETVGAVLHIDPEDDPIIGEKSTILFEVKDKENEFSIEKCTCAVKILQKNKEIYTETINKDAKNIAITYTFQNKGSYTIQLTGESIDDSFHKFKVEYPIVVSRNKEKSKQELLIAPSLAVLIGLVVIAVILIAKRKKPTP